MGAGCEPVWFHLHPSLFSWGLCAIVRWLGPRHSSPGSLLETLCRRVLFCVYPQGCAPGLLGLPAGSRKPVHTPNPPACSLLPTWWWETRKGEIISRMLRPVMAEESKSDHPVLQMRRLSFKRIAVLAWRAGKKKKEQRSRRKPFVFL